MIEESKIEYLVDLYLKRIFKIDINQNIEILKIDELISSDELDELLFDVRFLATKKELFLLSTI